LPEKDVVVSWKTERVLVWLHDPACTSTSFISIGFLLADVMLARMVEIPFCLVRSKLSELSSEHHEKKHHINVYYEKNC